VLSSGGEGADTAHVDPWEELAAAAYDEDVAVTHVIRPAAVLPEAAARTVLVELAVRDVRSDGLWWSSPVLWQRWDRPWDSTEEPGGSQLIGTMQVAYGSPTKYAITIFRATITSAGQTVGWTVEALCDEALGFGGFTLADCPRADLTAPPPVFKMR
jgi:hypothetical protein